MKLFPVIVLALILSGCSAQRKLETIAGRDIRAGLSLAEEREVPELGTAVSEQSDTMHVMDEEGKDVLIMKAIKDDDGEMVAMDVIKAAKVESRFRNVAERHGKVDLIFDVIVPAGMQDSKWQLRFYPDLFVMSDSIRLDPVIITGSEYRKAQLRGYEQYERFLASIITDSSKFLYARQLEVFLKRNMPEVFRFKNDTSVVSDEVFFSHYGVSEQMAVEHYTRTLMMKHNKHKEAIKDKMFRKYVKVPIVSEGLRLDTVLTGYDKDIIYRYKQTITTRAGLRKASVKLPGEIYEGDEIIYKVPSGDSLTFYISSISTLLDNREKYLKKVIGRRVEANTFCYIEFDTGKYDVNPSIGENGKSISMIKYNLASLLENKEFDMDSILVSAWCSPEGDFAFNDRLSGKRAQSVSEYFRDYVNAYRDSASRAEGVMMDMDGKAFEREYDEIKFISKSNGENWDMLEKAVNRDSTIADRNKNSFSKLMKTRDPDERERKLGKEPYYRYLREKIYPSLRTVRFDFHLHRKGMVKDTIHTTELDTLYIRGLDALRDRDYKSALSILRPYRDLNTAVAFCALDYNASALDILEKLERTDKVLYMLALVKSRTGDETEAVKLYRKACEMNPSFISRGNLDPEISSLITKYGLNQL